MSDEMTEAALRWAERNRAATRDEVVAMAAECLRLRARVAELEDALARVRRAGAESMRERAVAECEARARYVQDADMTSAYELRTVVAKIRALPLDDDGGPCA